MHDFVAQGLRLDVAILLQGSHSTQITLRMVAIDLSASAQAVECLNRRENCDEEAFSRRCQFWGKSTWSPLLLHRPPTWLSRLRPRRRSVIYNWTGFYIGANGGWGQSHNCWDFVFVVGPVFSDGCRDRSGGLLGGQIGYRWQSNQFVFGLEAQGDWADLSNTRVSLLDPTLSTTVKTDGIGLFTGQIGWAWNAALLYVKGGAAVTSNRFDIFDTPTGIGLVSASATRWGGTLGVGFEYGFTPNWSFGAEYNHLWMGNCEQLLHRGRSAPCGHTQQPDHSGCGYVHFAHQLPLRWLWAAGGGALLTVKLSPANSKPRPLPGPFCRLDLLAAQNVGGVQAEITSHGLPPTQRNRCGRRLSK